jgi:hypothetical protein
VSEADADRLIRRWAASHAPELIAQAQAEALEIARGRLVDALLEAASARMTAAPRSAPAEPDAPAAASDPVLWVYGAVTSAAGRPRAAGVDGRPVRVHEHAGVTALVSEVPRERFSEAALKDRLEDLEELEGLARPHEAVLEAAMAAGAVVPFRLCTIYSSPDALDAMLDREGLSLTAALDRLEGMQEWGVKAYVRDAEPASTPGAPSEAASGADYLARKRERRDAAVAGREASETVAAEVHARLTERAAAATLGRPQDRRLSGREEEMLLNAAYLVPAQEAQAFRELVEALGRRHEPDGIAVELTGPWPPYHFVEPPSGDDDA